MTRRYTRREFIARTSLGAAAIALPATRSLGAPSPSRDDEYPVGELVPVGPIGQRPEWKRFVIWVWQWQTDVRVDHELYERVGLHGFHIDPGTDDEQKVRLSLARKFPYYVDHAAGKGILYLQKTEREVVSGKSTLQVRPYSLADPKTIAELKSRLRNSVATTRKGLVYAYAFDDEISLAAFNNPVEVDIHPSSIAWYRKWLARRYTSTQYLNAAWNTAFASFDEIQPVGFDDVRKAAERPPLASWNLSAWMEWRHFMDYQFAQTLAGLTRYTNTLDPAIPAGFVGAQMPSAYGGYDYGLLSRAVQWMESPDGAGAEEILRSLWNRPRRIRVHTYDARRPHKTSVWLLWKHLAHGNQAAIAWPEGWLLDAAGGERRVAPAIERLAPDFREVQGSASEFVVDPASYLEADPIALYYSHPSIRAGWVMDSITHGATWPRRLTSTDDANLSSGWLRLSWCKLLEDLGYQYDFINYLDVAERRVDLASRFKVIILPRTICLSQREVDNLHAFVQAGGTLIADSMCGVLTETGRGLKTGALDDLFGVRRDESRGYLNGRTLTEVDAERAREPFPQRLYAYNGAISFRSMIVVERGTRAVPGVSAESAGSAHVLIRSKLGTGRTVYLNLTPLAYAHFPHRAGRAGVAWRELIGRTLRDAGLAPRVEIDGDGGREPWMESLLWRNGNRYCLAILKNVVAHDDAMEIAGTIDQDPRQIAIRIHLPVRELTNTRSATSYGDTAVINDRFNPWQANLYTFTLGAK